MATAIQLIGWALLGSMAAQTAQAQPCAAWTPAGNDGYLLPAGYLSTRGSDFVDGFGNPVRIASIGWDGSDGKAGAISQGLWTVSYRTILESIKAAGFNTVRIPWSNVNLDVLPANTPAMGTIDFAKNFDLHGLTVRQVLHKFVDYAGSIGLKVIFDHHSDEGCCGQQTNGLWFDSGPGTDGTDGAGNRGTVTAIRFERDWARFAIEYRHNATVIGFDLANEPTSVGHINWGRGGPTDIKAMYETVGAAILSINPDVLIIAEGPQTYAVPAANSGMKARAPQGNLTGVATAPVVLPIAHKIVYSVHEYPNEIAGFQGADHGVEFIARMETVWGWLLKSHIAPVWIGEMGSSMRTPESQAWAQTLLDYMNRPDRTVSGSWWHIGPASDEPDGLQTAWGLGAYRTAQLAVTDRMLFKPRVQRTCNAYFE